MRLRDCTLALVLACSVAVLAPAPAGGAGPTCFGEEPTITSSGYIEGTDGDDVIVADPGSEVHAFGGDDLVCGAATCTNLERTRTCERD